MPKVLSTARNPLSKKRSLLFLLPAIAIMATFGGSALTSTSTAASALATAEAETMSVPAGTVIVRDAAASGASYIKLTSAGSAMGPVTLPSTADNFTVRAKGDQCKGAPLMSVSVDGAKVLSSTVSATTWTNYSVAILKGSGAHTVGISFTNPFSSKNCSRNLHVDYAAFYGPVETPAPLYTYQTLQNPDRTMAYDAAGNWVATFTQGSRTVAVKGPQRTFAETPNTTATVANDMWVRVYPSAFAGQVDESWLKNMLADTSPDILQISMQYIQGAPTITDNSNLRIASDADYGPLQADGTRQEGADFNDYLGLNWNYGTSTDNAETGQYGSLDCSGFQRMVWGYRGGLPLTISPNGGAAIPRRSFEIYQSAPGIIVTADNGTQVTDFSKLQPGDIVFQDADTGDGTQIDHMGMYLGVDSAGNQRFISSRKTVNGPTMGDTGGYSKLDGTNLYAKSFRAIRRF